MAFNPEEVPPENIEMIGRPVQESSCVKTRPWPSSDKQSHNHPGAVDTLGTNSKPVFAHDEEMTKTGVEEEGLALCEMMEKVEGVEEGKMEEKAEEKVAEAKLGVLCSLEGMPGSCLSQEAEPQSPTMAEHKSRPDGSTAEGQIKVTDRIAGQKKVFRKRQKAKPKMQTAEAAGTEGGPRNTRAPFRLQDFMCSKISKHTVLVLLVLLAVPMNSNATPKQRAELPSSATPSAASPAMCAVCPDPRCATIVTRSFPENSNSRIKAWRKGKSQTVPMCSKDNLMPNAACQTTDGRLVQPANETLHFEGTDSSGVPHTFKSQNSPCAELNLSSSSTPSHGVPHLAPMTKAPNHNMLTPADQKDSVADNKDINGSGSGSGIGIGIGIGISGIIIGIIILIGVLIWKFCNCRRGQDRGRRQGNNRVPPHDTEHRDEITIEIQPLNAEVANGNVNGVH